MERWSIVLEIVDSVGNKKTFDSLKNLKANTHFGVQKGLWRSGKDIHGTFNKQVLAKNKTGRIYIRKDRLGRGRRHQASAAGESPANRTGFYRKSAGFFVRKMELVFGASAPYAGFLELGTSRMAKRPGLGNAVDSSQRDILRNLSDEVLETI